MHQGKASLSIGEVPPPYSSPAEEYGAHDHACVEMEHKPLPPPYSPRRYWFCRTLRCGRRLSCGNNTLLGLILFVVVAWFVTDTYSKYIIIGTELPTSQIESTTFHMHASTKTTPISPPVTTSRAPASAASTQAAMTLTSQPTQAPATSQVNDQMQVPTQPPSAPVWSFSLTCSKLTLSGTILSAWCYTKDGRTLKHSQLDLNCIIENSNGVLKWAKENGNFKDSLKSLEHSFDHGAENILRGKCRILDLPTVPSRYIDCSINLNEGIENSDGDLTPHNGSGCKPVPEIIVSLPVRKCTFNFLGICISMTE